MLDKYINIFRTHERLILLLVVLSFGSWGLSRTLGYFATRDMTQATTAQKAADAAQTQNAQLAAQVALQATALQQAESAQEKATGALLAAMGQRDSASQGKVVVVQQPKTPSAAVADLQGVYNLPTPVTVTATGADIPTEDIQLFTVAKIEGDTAKADLLDEQKIAADVTANLTQANGLISAYKTEVDGLNGQIVLDKKACTAQVTAIKADARKSKSKWFKIGVVVGFVAGFMSGHAI
jgi:hypothetical protein